MSYQNDNIWEGRIYLFDSHTNSVKQIARFSTWLRSYQVDIAKDKVDYFIWHCQFCKFHIFALNSVTELFEIFDLNTRQITRGNIIKSIDWFNFIAFLQAQILLNGVLVHLLLISKTNLQGYTKTGYMQ